MEYSESPRPAPPISILMYHQVGEFESPKAHRAGFCHIRRFRAQMAYLKHLGYQVISLQQACDGLFQGGPLPSRPVVLTFDDGYRNFKDYALPVLRRHGFNATVFIVAGLVGRNAKWLEDNGRHGPDLMSATMLRELREHGITLGSHTISHPRLSRIDSARMQQEIVDSKAVLEDILGEKVQDFCYPFGDYNRAVRETVREAGYTSGLTCIRGAANEADNPFEIPRKAISFGDTLVGYFWKLHMKNKRKDRG